MSRGIRPWWPAALAAGLSTGCALFEDSQTKSLDLAALAEGEGYAVGTITSAENYTEEGVSQLTEAPDIDYSVVVCEAHDVDSLGAALMAALQDSATSWRIGVEGEKSPALFALKLPAGVYCLKSLERRNGNMTTTAPIGLLFDVVPGDINYVGDVRLQLNSSSGLFGTHYYTSVHSSAQDDRGLFDKLLPARFPDAHPTLNVAIARIPGM